MVSIEIWKFVLILFLCSSFGACAGFMAAALCGVSSIEDQIDEILKSENGDENE